jgi:hypothetical protein
MAGIPSSGLRVLFSLAALAGMLALEAQNELEFAVALLVEEHMH